jgi:hypothetical protein
MSIEYEESCWGVASPKGVASLALALACVERAPEPQILEIEGRVKDLEQQTPSATAVKLPPPGLHNK